MPVRHERRRRLLTDDVTGVAGGESTRRVRAAGRADTAGNAPGKSYTEAAKLAHGRALSALLPSRLLTIALTAAVAVTVVAACLALHAGSAALAALAPAVDATVLRLDEDGSIGHWWASMLLVTAGVVALFIFSLRRHRIDDYHGRYRVWIWISFACLAASLFETTRLERLVRGLSGLAAERFSISNDVLWPSFVGVIAAAVGLRLFFEIRRCPSAIGALAASAVSFVAAAAAYHGWPVTPTSASLCYWSRGSWLVGYVFVLTTFLLYARHVQLDLNGSLVSRATRKRKAPKAPAEDEAETEPPKKPALRLRTDLDPVEPAADDTAAGSQSNSASSKSAPADNDSESGGAEEPQRRLSRAERRRMRRQARMAS